MKGFNHAEDLLSRAQKTVTINIRESDVFHVCTQCDIWRKKTKVDRDGRI